MRNGEPEEVRVGSRHPIHGRIGSFFFVCLYLWLGVAVEDHGIAAVDLDGEPKLSLPVSRKLCSDTLNM